MSVADSGQTVYSEPLSPPISSPGRSGRHTLKSTSLFVGLFYRLQRNVLDIFLIALTALYCDSLETPADGSITERFHYA